MTTEHKTLRYQVAIDQIQCRADLLSAEVFEVEDREYEWGYDSEDDTEVRYAWTGRHIKVLVAAWDRDSAEHFIRNLDPDWVKTLSTLPIKTF